MASSSGPGAPVPVEWTTAPAKRDRLVVPPDGAMVALAAVGSVLLVLGQLLADVVERDATTGWRLAVDAAIALGPAALAVALLRQPTNPHLRAATLLAALVALGAAFTVGDDRASAAAFAVSPCLVLIACRPRWRLSPAVAWRRVGGAALGLVVVAGLVVAPAGQQHRTSLELTSGRLDDAQDAIGAADARFLADTLGAAQRTPGARCYFARQVETDAFSDFVACGPVVHPPEPIDPADPANPADEDAETTTTTEPPDFEDEGPTGAWDLYPVRVDDGELRISAPHVGRAVDPGLLHRPDGLRPPRGDGDDPAGATVSPGFAMALSFDDSDNIRPAGGFVLAGAGKVTIERVAAPDRVVAEDGVERQAPEGYRLVAAELAFEDVEGITLEVLSGNDRVDITDTVSESGEFFQDGWVVAVARDDGVDAQMEITYRGRAQRLSLATGERVGGAPLLYDPATQTLDKIVDPSSVTITVPVPSPHTGDVDIGGYTIARADLVAFEPNLGWAPPGQAWLAVSIQSLDEPSFFDIDAGDIDDVFRFDPTRSFALQPAGGSSVAPAGAAPDNEGNLSVVFPVPDRARTFTFRSTPTWRLIFNTTAIDVRAPTVDTALTLR